MDGSASLEMPAAFAAFHERFAARFRRSEVRERSARYLQGLLGPVERKNGWQLAEAAGERDPAGMQRLLYEASWAADEVLADYQTWVVEQFGSPDAIVVFDDTGFIKKGTKSVGVQRQYSGTAGKVENCQVGVFMAYVTPSSHLLLDRRLYLPEVWSEDPARRTEAGVPARTTFQTIPHLALAMLRAAWQRGVPQAWVTADEGYGKDPTFLAALEQHGQRYVIAVATTAPVWAERPGMEVGPRVGAISPPRRRGSPPPRRSWPTGRPRPGSAWWLAWAPRARGWTTGPRHAWLPAGPRCPGRNSGCWRGARRATPPNGRTTWGSPHPRPRWRRWPGWRRRAGRLSSA